MPWDPQTLPDWKSDRAVLLVHGIGNAAPGDYVELVEEVRAALGPAADTTAIYQLWYDQVNDWFSAKNQLGDLFQQALTAVSDRIADPELGPTLADMLGDILWPVLVTDARTAVREAYLLQLKQMVQDGVNSGYPARRQRLSIICHSLGCFHTYEVLHHAALYPSHQLQPATHAVVFENVIFMASPVQLIRTVADALGPLVPNKRWLYSTQGDALTIPSQAKTMGGVVRSVKRWVSITGALDPVGGYFFRHRADWAYMQVDGQEPPIVDAQHALNITSKAQLAAALRASLRDRQPPTITPTNPHSWEAYVSNHAAELRSWLA